METVEDSGPQPDGYDVWGRIFWYYSSRMYFTCTTVQSVPDKLANLVNLGLAPNLDLAYAEGGKKTKNLDFPSPSPKWVIYMINMLPASPLRVRGAQP